MEILVQQKGSRLFLGKNGIWVEQKECAERFNSSAEALEHCMRHAIHGFEILLTFQDSIWDIRLPGTDESKRKKPALLHKTPQHKSH